MTTDFHSDTTFFPKAFALGSEPQLQTKPFSSFHLDSKNPLATLDYGYEIAGTPFFDVSKLAGVVQVEVKYAKHLFH